MYFLSGVVMQTGDVLSRAERINTLLNNWRGQVLDGSSSLPAKIVEYLTGNPWVSLKAMAEGKGFEPLIRFWRIHAFQACSFNRSDTPPRSHFCITIKSANPL